MDSRRSSSSLLSKLLQRDPFDDPFFRSAPFQSIFDSPFFSPSQPKGDSLRIEEVPVDASSGGRAPSPIVEHPDDCNELDSREVNSGWLQMPKIPSNGGAYTFSSSSVRYDGPKGAYYAATKLRRGGPEGVVEERFEERDSTTNKHTKRMSRGLKDKGHTFACQKDMKTGKVEENEILHNLKEDEVNDFDAKWEQAAEKYIPGWAKGTPQLTGKTRSLHGRRSMKSLPSK